MKVLVFGVFDGLHKGHLHFLKQTKEKGDFLIVVAGRDSSVKKNKNKIPKFSEQERLKSLERCEFVDKALLGEEGHNPKEDSYNIIKEINPDIICLGYDQTEYKEKLENELKRMGLKAKVFVLKPYKPKIYKSSIFKQKDSKINKNNMLDINKIRENKEEVKKSLLKRLKEEDFNLDEIISLDDNRKKLLTEVEKLKAERNKNSKSKPTPEIIEEMKKIGEKIKQLDEDTKNTEQELKAKLSDLPNLAAEDVVKGGKENNKVLREFGKKQNFNFEPKDHVDLAESLNLIDYERGAKMSGSGFWVYKGQGALLEWALLNYFIDFHKKNKYEFLLLPYLLTEESAYTSGHLPKFKDDLFWTQDKLCLNATSEMMALNYHRDESIPEKDLPKKYFSYSTCFRREAGSYRTEERGMIRGHQFNKIEMFQFTKPEDSWSAFDELVKNAESLVNGLSLHFQSVQLAAQDMSSSMAKTVDIEVWIPSMNIFKEVSSCSNGLDYQARRGNIKYKNSAGKNDYLHTLNASGLATSRLVPAILEQFQQKDGSVKIPKVLHKYTGFKIIKPIV